MLLVERCDLAILKTIIIISITLYARKIYSPVGKCELAKGVQIFVQFCTY